MSKGKVKWFNDAKGFGFITPDDGGKDLFAHSADVRGGKKLKARQRVEFDVRDAATGASAANIRTVA